MAPSLPGPQNFLPPQGTEGQLGHNGSGSSGTAVQEKLGSGSGWTNIAERLSGQSGPYTLHVVGRVQANAATLQLALAPALFILLAHLQQLLPWGKED